MNPGYPWHEDPGMPGPQRLSIGGWLVKPYHYFFYAAHAYWDAGTARAQIEFVDWKNDTSTIPGDNYSSDLSDRWREPAFSDIGVNPEQYQIVQINACWSGGYFLTNSYETSIPQAFGNYGAVDSGQTYIGWDWKYLPGASDFSFYGVHVPTLDSLYPCGTLWTTWFWLSLGDGYSVQQAIGYADYWYGGYAAVFLYGYGGTYVTWLCP